MTHPLSEGTKDRQETQKRPIPIGMFLVMAFILALTALVVCDARAEAMPISQAEMERSAVVPNTDQAANDPVKALVAELVRRDPNVASLLMAVGSSELLPTQTSSSEGVNEAYPPIGTRENVVPFCENGSAGIQFAGTAPHDGWYEIVLTPRDHPDQQRTLFSGFLKKGEKVALTEPAEENAVYKVALSMPAEPDDSASPFNGIIDVTTSTCP